MTPFPEPQVNPWIVAIAVMAPLVLLTRRPRGRRPVAMH
jgi:hypothetical protein